MLRSKLYGMDHATIRLGTLCVNVHCLIDFRARTSLADEQHASVTPEVVTNREAYSGV